MSEYLQYSLHCALLSTHERMVDLLREWDDDNNGKISPAEFEQAVTVLGFGVPPTVSRALFARLDADHSGYLNYKELAESLQKEAGRNQTKMNILAAPEQANYDEKGVEYFQAKNVNKSFVCMRVNALPTTAQLDTESSLSLEEQLGILLTLHSSTLIDLFRTWDVDGNGGVDKKEFRKALVALGYKVSKQVVDSLFDKLNVEQDSFIEFGEMKKALKRFVHAANAPVTETVQRPKDQLFKDVEAGKQYNFEEFAALVASREGFTDKVHVRQIFDAFDKDSARTCGYLAER